MFAPFLILVILFWFTCSSIHASMFDSRVEMSPTNWVYVDAKRCFVATFERPSRGYVLTVSCLLANGKTEVYAEVLDSGHVRHKHGNYLYVACVGRTVEVYAFTCGERRPLKLYYRKI